MEKIFDMVGWPRNYGHSSEDLQEEERRRTEEMMMREAQKRAEEEQKEAEEARQRAATWEAWVGAGGDDRSLSVNAL